MDASGNIYEMNEAEQALLASPPTPETLDEILTLREDRARLNGYLKGRAESDKRKHEQLVWDSVKQGTYRKDA